MKAIFDNYGRVITAVIAILAIIGIVTATMPLMQENYKSINTQMMAKVGNEDSTPSGGGNGGGSAPSQTDYGINIMQWDVSKNQDNSVVANYYVKEENQHPKQSQSAMMSLFKPMTAYAADNKTVTIDGVTYTLSDDDTIVISGSGEMMENLQSKLCDYAAIERDVKNHFASDYQYFDDNNITLYAYDSNTDDYKEGIFQTNGTAQISKVKYQNIMYKARYTSLPGAEDNDTYFVKILDNGKYDYNCKLDSNIANKIDTFENSVNKYVSEIASNYSVTQPKNLVIAEGITNIGKNAFRNCSNLTNVQLPSTLKSIDYGAFSYTKITDIIIPDSVTTIGRAAFGFCKSLENVTMSSGLTTLDMQAFVACTALKELDLSNTLITEIKNNTFNSSGLVKILLPNTLKTIDKAAFINCSTLTSVTIPNSVTSLGSGAFQDCTSLENIVLPNTLNSIDEYEFMNCSSLKEINLPEGITTIPKQAFYNCSSLTTLNIPESVTAIGINAFCSCSSLTKVVLPQNLTILEDSAFAECNHINEINIPDSITYIGEYLLNGTQIKSFKVPNKVTKIGRNSFNNCTKLTEIYIPKSVTSIDIYAFYTIAPNSTIYCENQAVADLFKDGTNYKSSTTKIVVDATKFA